MAERIPQSATIRIPLQAYLSTDHVSPATGKTIAITISKNGAAYGNPSGGATNATEIASGSYYVDLSTTDTGTTGPLFVMGTSSGVDNVVAIYDVVLATNGGFTGIPNAAPGAAGGVFIAGTNAATTVTTAFTTTFTGNLTGSVASVTAAVSISTAQALGSARALDSIADTSLTINDALQCAVAAAAGKEAIVGTAFTVKTPSTGTTLRTFTLDSGTAPTSRS